MTAKQLLEACLIELSKQHAPSMRLEDFNYFINKAINQYVNKRYNIYDIGQQTSDDLRVLKSTSILDVNKSTYTNYYENIYETEFPTDYLHLLNFICVYKVNKNNKCFKKDTYVKYPAKRLTSDAWSIIMEDYYNKPTPQRPYYFIHNVNTSTTLPTNPITEKESKEYSGGTDGKLPRTIKLGTGTTSVVDRESTVRYGNASKIRCEIRYGEDDSVFTLSKVIIDYIKTPQEVKLTQDEMDLVEDTSQIIEFPDYVCHEIINELVILVMEHHSDPRLNTHAPVTQSIALPGQQQSK